MLNSLLCKNAFLFFFIAYLFLLVSCSRDKEIKQVEIAGPDIAKVNPSAAKNKKCPGVDKLNISEIDMVVWGLRMSDSDNDWDNCWTFDLLSKIKVDIRWGIKAKEIDYSTMAKIPGGEAIVGCGRHYNDPVKEKELNWEVTKKNGRYPTDCLPRANVNIPEFYVDKTVITFDEYSTCVRDKMCLPSLKNDHIENHKNPGMPALLTYKQSERYCLWAGKRLPTEYEWEKAVRGPKGLRYPWGNNMPEPEMANICDKECTFSWADKDWDDGYIYISPVGAFPAGNSPFGLTDASGNVKEWAVAATTRPKDHYIAKGASWYSTKMELLAFYRQLWTPRTRVDDKGARCVADTKEMH